MVIRNLLRRKGRTALTILGISIGVAAIIALGALADGLQAGYSTVLSGGDADVIITSTDAYDITLSSLDENILAQVAAMPQVEQASPLTQGLVQAGDTPYFFVFGYPEGSFSLGRFQLRQGVPLYAREADQQRGTPLLLGTGAAEALNLGLGDTIRLNNGAFRITGIYETGDSFEDGAAVIRLEDAQTLLNMPRRVSAVYVRLEDPSLEACFRERAERQRYFHQHHRGPGRPEPDGRQPACHGLWHFGIGCCDRRGRHDERSANGRYGAHTGDRRAERGGLAA